METKPIEGYEGKYTISEGGEVYSVKRVRVQPNGGNRDLGGKYVKISTDRYGYSRVMLCKDGAEKFTPVHRLVAKAFISNPLNLPQVNHKNGIKVDNRVENLEWVTGSQNREHARKNGLQKSWEGEKNVKSKLTVENVISIRNMKKDGFTLSEISKVFGVSTATVSKAQLGRTWSNIKYFPSGPDDVDAEEVEVKRMTDEMTSDELTQERNGDEPF